MNGKRVLAGPEDLPGVGDLLGSFRWYDALCINQNDNQERSQQVRNMRQIYSRAEEVFAWVGHGNRSHSLGNLGLRLSQIIQEITNAPKESFSLEVLGILGWSKDQSELSEAATVFFGEQYWRRVWIIQEITVASKVTILYHDHEFRWEDVAAFLREMEEFRLIRTLRW